MRYLVGFACVLAALMASPLSVSAQVNEEGTEPNVEESAPSSEPVPEEPALQLKLDYAGVGVAPGYPPRFDELELRVKRARIGLGVSVPFIWIGVLVAAIGIGPFVASEEEEESSTALIATGTVMSVGGLGGTIASGILLSRRKRELRRLEQAHYGIPARTRRGYTLEEAELRVKRARIGLGVSAGIWVLGVALLIPGTAGDCNNIFVEYLPDRCQPLLVTGSVLTFLGVVGMITTGFLSLRRKRDRDRLRPADYGTPRRVQWDLERSRLVF